MDISKFSEKILKYAYQNTEKSNFVNKATESQLTSLEEGLRLGLIDPNSAHKFLTGRTGQGVIYRALEPTSDENFIKMGMDLSHLEPKIRDTWLLEEELESDEIWQSVRKMHELPDAYSDEKGYLRIPKDMESEKEKLDLDLSIFRDYYVKWGSFPFLSERWIQPFVEWIGSRRCLEVMAGRGVLSAVLRQEGVYTTATDDFSWANCRVGFDHWTQKQSFGVKDMDAIESVKKYGKLTDILIMSWPEAHSPAKEVIQEFHSQNPNGLVVYIGEGKGDSCADEDFFQHFEITPDKEFLEIASLFEKHFLVQDGLMLGRYKDGLESSSAF